MRKCNNYLTHSSKQSKTKQRALTSIHLSWSAVPDVRSESDLQKTLHAHPGNVHAGKTNTCCVR